MGASLYALLAAAPAASQTLPTGGEVVAGGAVIGGISPTGLTISQTSARAILTWKRFSVGDGMTVRFDNGRGATLNRVTGGDLSRIDGALSASGSVYLINPAGVIVGANGVVSTGGTFLASSLDLPDASFLAGGGLTFTGAGDAGVINLGRITAASGDILLIARTVENAGTLEAPGGTVGLAAGTRVSLADAQGAGGRVRVDLGSADASVTQSGRIASAVAELKTQNGNIYALAGNAGGEVLAGSLSRRDGRVWIDAGEGAVQVGPGARIAAASGADGGAVSISGGLVFNQGAVTATGRKGGEISVSGGAVYNTGALEASGTAGDGGRISVSAERGYIETASGALSATGTRRGGSLSVDGGASLYTSGTWSASAPGGVGGAITALGDRITLNEASLSANGGLGGRIRIGGDYRGLGDLRHALEVMTTPGARVSATSEYARYGGSVVYWSTGLTEVWGRTQAGGAGLIEVSSKGEVRLGGLADAGVGGQVLLDPKSIVIDAATGVYPQYQLLNPGSASGSGFGATILALPGGNVVVAASADSVVASAAGAVYLFDGTTGALISTLTGSRANDGVGSSLTSLGNGNYVVRSSAWDNGAIVDAGAVTWGSGTSGVSGIVSAANSLVGSSASDQVGSQGIIVLTSGNYLVRSQTWDNGAAVDAGAVTWGSGTSGVSGAISAVNSLVGTRTGDQIGNFGIYTLTNGNYVVASTLWDNGAATDAGAATWGSGTTGVSGAVSAANSLVGTTSGDQVGGGGNGGAGVIALTNGNYVVRNGLWDSGAVANVGAVTWGSGLTGISGPVSAANSLVGSQADDQLGTFITALTNGNYVVVSASWDNGAVANAGAVTWGSGTTGVTGTISAANSLVGTKVNDLAGFPSGVTALTNGNYVVISPNWDNGAAFDAGAVTWGSGTTGVTGVISAANSLVGTTPNDQIGNLGVVALTNGNYVVRSSNYWRNGAVANAGAVTWGSGTTGVTGAVSSANSLVGSTVNDRIGSGGVVVLPSGNYLVRSPSWDNGSATDAGAVTWGSGASGVSGVISAANSLVGTTALDSIGSQGVTVLTNGNYVVRSTNWDNGAVVNVGAVTWGSGTIGISGAVSSANSLVGTSPSDMSGGGVVTALTNGNYVVLNSLWDNGAVIDAGAVTWGSGTTGVTGAISAANSLVGSQANDYVGLSGILALTNGNYVVRSPAWDNGAIVDAGAATWGSGTTGVTGAISAANSLTGSTANDSVGVSNVLAMANGDYLIRTSGWTNGAVVGAGAVTWGSGTSGVSGTISAANSLVGVTTGESLTIRGVAADSSYFFASGGGRLLVGLTSLNQLTYNRAVGQTVTLQPSALAAQLATGSSLTLQASNDITLNSALTVPGTGGGVLTLQAGRSLLINGNITTANGALNLYANALLSSGVIDADRDPGAAVISMAPGTSINAGSGQVRIHLGPGTGKTNLASGAISLGSITAAGITVENAGTSAGSNIVLNSGAVLSASGAGDAIRLAANGAFINNAGASALSAPAGRWLVYSQQTNSAGLAPVGNVLGGLAGKSWYGIRYAFGSGAVGSFPHQAGAGNRFVYGYQPTLTVAPASGEVTYFGGTSSATAVAVSGVLPGDSASDAWSGAPALSGLTSKNVGTYSVTPALGTLTSGLNYAFSFTPGTLKIVPAPLTLSAVATNKIYDATTTSSATPSVFGLQGVDTVTGLEQAYDSRNAGPRTLSVVEGYRVNDGNGGANYTIDTATASGTIARAPLTLAATPATKVYDGTTASPAAPTVTGLKGSDTVTGLSQAYDSRNAGARTLTLASGYVVNDGAGGGNYDLVIGAITALGTITRAPLTLAATPATKVYDGTTASPAAPTVTGLKGSDTVTGLSQVYDSRNAGARTLTVASGFAINDGNSGGNYDLTLGPLSTSGSITPAPLVLSAVTARKTYDGSTASTVTPTASGLKGSDTVSGLSQAYDSQNAGARTLSVSGGYKVNDGNGGGNYAVTLSSASGVIDRRILAIAAGDRFKLAGDVDPPLTWTLLSGDLVSGDALAGALRRASGEGVGLYAILQGDLTAGANYQIDFTNGRFEVRPRPFSVTPERGETLGGASVLPPKPPVSGVTSCPRSPEDPESASACEGAPGGGGD